MLFCPFYAPLVGLKLQHRMLRQKQKKLHRVNAAELQRLTETKLDFWTARLTIKHSKTLQRTKQKSYVYFTFTQVFKVEAATYKLNTQPD